MPRSTRLANKVAVITGAGSGMGKAMAQLFVREGAKVVCADRSGKEEETAADLGDAAIAVHVDVAISEDVRSIHSRQWNRIRACPMRVNPMGSNRICTARRGSRRWLPIKKGDGPYNNQHSQNQAHAGPQHVYEQPHFAAQPEAQRAATGE